MELVRTVELSLDEYTDAESKSREGTAVVVYVRHVIDYSERVLGGGCVADHFPG